MTGNFDMATAVATSVLAVASVVAGVLAYRTWQEQRRGTRSQVGVAEETKPVLAAQLPVLQEQLSVLQEQLADFQRAAKERRRQQAVQLVAWIDDASTPAGPGASGAPRAPLIVVNNADAPAYNVTIGWGATFTGAPPDQQLTTVAKSEVRLVQPKQRIAPDVPDSSELRARLEAGDLARAFDAYVEFDDADGYRWRRFASGLLLEVD